MGGANGRRYQPNSHFAEDDEFSVEDSP